ncbi:hypothetical protein [Abyssogena phaseoliformis symbiont]|uniref:hypothetical protein n=1 Tax=Abyssogena phaseoliformis symbiont TaxID=596095 RepID=UPI001CED674B|nr:hypothetical protein [Abyssogena phaseoliformis symbiont]
MLSYIDEKMSLFMYGIYPSEEYWRPNLLLAIMLAFVFIVRFLKYQVYKNKATLMLFIIYPLIAFFLLYGNDFLGIKVVETNQWGVV